MKNKFVLLVALMLSSIQASYGLTESVFNSSATGTTSATVFVPKGSSLAEVRDLSWKGDSNVTTLTIGQYIGARKFNITSATASAASVLWFANPDSGVAVGSFIIFLDANVGTYYLRRVTATTTTSITLLSSIAVTTTTDDVLWSCAPVVEKPIIGSVSSTGGMVSIWLPADVPSALVIDGNTTACRISISGYRGARQ